ncbi:reverse transcriptase domain-containing protein [Tanacetum coccineum]|uniref:Reverse transcriptase domain-containing protein n=1 Tax=Tanacetum coccineum TaxID=301880 RepID=A0ABQ5BF72_9ASTR
MVVRITKQGYYWPSMHRDATKVLQDCEKCKEQSTIRKVARSSTITAGSRWSFSHWGVNILGPLPTALGGFKFLAIAVEHSTKWVEAKPLTVINGRHAERFVWEYVVCRFRVSRTSARRTRSISEKQLARSQQGWVDDLAQVLWVHRTLPRNSQKETPFSLTYGCEAIISISENDVAKDDKGRIKEVDKRRGSKEIASIEEAYYRSKLCRHHNKRSSHSIYKIGDFVLLLQNNTGSTQVWKGPHMVIEVQGRGLYKIADASDHSLT